MADNNRHTIKKVSIVLSVICIIFATVATILHKNHQIDLISYSAPFVIGTVVTILTCAALQRLFCSLLAKNYLSFGWNTSIKTEAVALKIDIDNLDEFSQPDNTASTVNVVVQRPSYLEKYDARMEELERTKREKRTAIVSTIHDYTTYIMADLIFR